MNKPIPLHILSGFLGSGKTTFLTKALDHCTGLGWKPAVIMNEIGDVNLDGMLVDTNVPMTEMLSGCICCSIRGDLAHSVQELVLEHQPDVIFIESTGVANPMETIDGVTDASLLMPIELRSIITVVDAPHVLELKDKGKGKTLRLMEDQIRCASLLIVNKTDLVPSAQLAELEGYLRELNGFAPIHGTMYCQVDLNMLEALEIRPRQGHAVPQQHQTSCEHGHPEGESCGHHHIHEHHGDPSHHHSHEHVMAYTHYLGQAVDSVKFEELVGKLPPEVYRAKGILQFSDTNSRFLFQYAYRQSDYLKITPQGDVPNVVVFIGENFSKSVIQSLLSELGV